MQKQQNVPVDELFECDDETAYRDMLREELKKNWTGGFCRMPDAVRNDRSLSPKAKIVYEQLLAHMWFSTDRCYPAQQTLADETGYSRRTVIRACKELYERGYIEKWRRGQGHSNYYFINPLTFPRSFRRTERQRAETMILNVRAPERREDCTSSPPRPLNAALPLCQDDTSTSDNVSHPEVTNWHGNQTKGKQIQEKEMDSNDSSPPQKGTGFPVVTQATGNEQESQTASCDEHTPHRHSPPESALQQWRNRHYANKPSPLEQERHTSTSATPNNEPAPPSKHPNSSSWSCSQGNAPAHAKDENGGYHDEKLQRDTKQAAIAAMTGIPEHHLEEMGSGLSKRRRPIPDFLRNMMSHFSRELGDNPWCTKSNITHAAKLYFFVRECIIEAQDDPQGFFLNILYQAKQAASHVTNVRYRNHEGRINRMPIFFTCLKNEMQLSEDEVLLVRSDELLYEPSW